MKMTSWKILITMMRMKSLRFWENPPFHWLKGEYEECWKVRVFQPT